MGNKDRKPVTSKRNMKQYNIGPSAPRTFTDQVQYTMEDPIDQITMMNQMKPWEQRHPVSWDKPGAGRPAEQGSAGQRAPEGNMTGDGRMKQPARQKQSGYPGMAGQRKQGDRAVDGERFHSSERRAYGQGKPREQSNPVEIKNDIQAGAISPSSVMKDGFLSVTPDRLQEAVIWSEILGKPVSKRRHRRMV